MSPEERSIIVDLTRRLDLLVFKLELPSKPEESETERKEVRREIETVVESLEDLSRRS